MGKINQGILGGFVGKVGNVVGFFWKGQAVMRSLAGSVANPQTEAQQTQRARFIVSGSLISSLYSVARQLLEVPARTSSISKSVSAVNVLMRNVLNALRGNASPATSPFGWDVDFANLNLSTPRYDSGGTEQPTGLSATNPSAGVINVTWTDNSGSEPGVASNDVVMLLAFPAQKNAEGKFEHSSVIFNDGDFVRRDTTGTINYPSTWSGKNVEIYAITRTPDGQSRTASAFIGELQAV